jgi:tRNA(adenine34) deaminase
MRRALTEAAAAPAHGDVPVGCVIVSAQGELLAAEHNRREADADPTAHAEIVALRRAARSVGRWRLDGSVVYVTLEPCPMCAGALVNARVQRLVYGAPDPKAGAVASLLTLGTDVRFNHRFSVQGGLLASEAVALLHGFFSARRSDATRAARGPAA